MPGMHFYPRSPRGERPETGDQPDDGDAISTLAPREGSDIGHDYNLLEYIISTLAPREGSDNFLFASIFLSC